MYAYPTEIDAWRAGRKVAPEPVARPLWKIPAFALTMLLCLVMVGNGVRPASAQGAAPVARQVWLTSDQDPSESVPSVDGRYIGYTDWPTGDLGVRDLISGTNRRLTNTGGWEASGDYAERTVISPDGRMMAYLWFIEKDNRDELRVIPVAGGSPRTVYRGTQANDYMFPYGWTPDGKQILVVQSLPDHTSRIAMVSVEGGAVRVIKSVGWQEVNAQLSPDGRFIAYDRPVDQRTNARDIFVLAADGSRETAIVEGPSNDTLPLWSPDGTRVLFITNRTGAASLWAVPMADGKPAGPATMIYADFASKRPLGITRGGALYYTATGAAGSNVYTADLDSSMKTVQPPRIATERFVNSNRAGSVSPDGDSLAYYSGRPGRGLVITVRSLKTGEERDIDVQQQLISNFGYGPMWAGDSRSLIVASRDPQRPGPLFLRVNAADGKTEALLHTGPLQGWALSPNGKNLYYAEQDPDSVPDQIATRLMRYDFDTKMETVLKRGSWVISISVSPDSSQVAYLVSGRGTQESGAPDRSCRLEVMPAEGGEARVIYRDTPWLDGSRYNGLGWSSDGRYLVFVRGGVSGNEPNSIWRVSLGGGQPEQITSMKGNIKNPQMHPDGRRIYFTVSEPTPSELWALENFLPKASGSSAR